MYTIYGKQVDSDGKHDVCLDGNNKSWDEINVRNKKWNTEITNKKKGTI